MKADELRALCRRVATAWKVYRMDDRDQDSYYAVADAHRAMSMVNANASEQVAAGITEALDDERRQTQRRMIAALYWRAGWAKDAAERERPSSQHRTALMRRYLSAREVASDMQIAMEAACAR